MAGTCCSGRWRRALRRRGEGGSPLLSPSARRQTPATCLADATPGKRSPMDAAQVFTIGQQALYTLLTVAAPVLLAVLVVGILVSIFQAATQINEATLTFVPKLLAAVAVMGVAGPWMLTSLVEYLRSVLLSLPSAAS